MALCTIWNLPKVPEHVTLINIIVQNHVVIYAEYNFSPRPPKINSWLHHWMCLYTTVCHTESETTSATDDLDIQFHLKMVKVVAITLFLLKLSFQCKTTEVNFACQTCLSWSNTFGIKETSVYISLSLEILLRMDVFIRP